MSLSGGKDLVYLLEWDQCAWRAGTRTGFCEMWLEGPEARSCGGSDGVRILDSVLRDFRRCLRGVGESSGWVTWPWTVGIPLNPSGYWFPYL